MISVKYFVYPPLPFILCLALIYFSLAPYHLIHYKKTVWLLNKVFRQHLLYLWQECIWLHQNTPNQIYYIQWCFSKWCLLKIMVNICCVFQPAFGCYVHPKAVKLLSGVKSLKKVWNEQKGWKWLKKVVRPALGCAQHPKAGWNTQQTFQTLTYLKSKIISVDLELVTHFS